MVSYNDILPGFNHKVQGCRWLWNMVPNSHYRLRGPMQEIQVSLYTDRAGQGISPPEAFDPLYSL